MQRFLDVGNTDNGASRPVFIALGYTDHPHIGMLSLRNAKAMGAIAAGRCLTLGAVHRLRQAQGQRHLANVGRADQQIGVGQPPLGQAGLKLLEDVVLTVNLPHGYLQRMFPLNVRGVFKPSSPTLLPVGEDAFH